MSAVIEWRQVGVIAAKEFKDRIRGRWVMTVSLVFAIFALLIAYFGPAQQGAVGFRSIEVTIASLTSLVIYLLPLIALILGYDAIVGEAERGTLDLLLAMPITRLELLLGKFLGLSYALTSSTLAGFGGAGLLLVTFAGAGAIWQYMGFVLSALLLGMSFLSMAMLVSVLARERTRAGGLAIAVWFFYVLVFDLLVLGALVATGGEWGGQVIPFLLLLNPADLFRLLNIFSMEDVKNSYAVMTTFPSLLVQPGLLSAALVLWIIAPLSLAIWRFK